jgi:hypothetical protein
MAKATEFETLNGFPRETITLANWRTRPYSFWAFRNVAEMVRSARIRTAAPSPLPAKVDSRDLLARPASPGASQPVADLLRSSQADSFLLSRNGRLVCEWHADGVDRSDPHLVFSISKSITALVAGILEDQGLLDPSTPVGKLVPEAGNSAYADATVQHLLDMRVSLDFDESYLSQLDYARYRRAMSWNPPSPEGGDEAMLSFLCSLRKAPGDHGGDHTYLSPNSDMLGIVLERISGEAPPWPKMSWRPPQSGQRKVAHVLDDAEHRHLDLAEHVQPLAGIDQREILRRRHDHRAGKRHLLRHGQLRVAGARRHVDDQHVEFAPGSTSRSIWLSAEITIGPRQIIGVSSSTRKPIDMTLTP